MQFNAKALIRLDERYRKVIPNEAVEETMSSTTNSHFVRAVLRNSEALGIDPEVMLEQIGIPLDVIQDDNTEARVPTELYASLVRNIWEMAGDEAFGLTQRKCSAGHFELMVRYVMQFETLETVMREACRFYRTVREDFNFRLDYEEYRVGFLLELTEPERDVDHFLSGLMLVTMHRFFCWITGTRIPLLESTFSFPKPQYADAYNELLPGDCSFDRDYDGFYIDKTWLNQPIAKTWKDSKTFLNDTPFGFIDIPGKDDSMSATLKGMLLSEHKKGNGFPDLSSIASRLCITEQTIRRRLLKEDTNYQHIKNEMRRDIAIDRLTHSEQPIADIGFQLGFVEASSFTRAFQQWTGVNPTEFRENLKKDH
jgi:AraC-like DNA-binding protein